MLALAIVLLAIGIFGSISEDSKLNLVTNSCMIVGVTMLALSDIHIPGGPWSIAAAVIIMVATGLALATWSEIRRGRRG